MEGGIMSLWGRLFRRKETQQSSIEHFIQRAVQGQPAECRIQIAHYPDFSQALRKALLNQGLSKSEVYKLLDTQLYSVCPNCGTSMTGEYLQWIEAMVGAQRGGATVIIGGEGGANRVVRFSRGWCVNEKCSAKDIVLYWQP
mgnify:CR=1 FL=1